MTTTTESKQEMIESLAGEMLFSGLLGKVFATYPHPQHQEWFESLLDPELFAGSPFAQDRVEVVEGLENLQIWIENNEGAPMDVTLLDLQTDATLLFNCANTILAPPWESVYKSKDRLVMQEHTLRVRQFYKRYGLELSESQNEPDDHIGLELLFVTYMTEQMIQALETEDLVSFEEFRVAKSKFLKDHLLQWSLLFCFQVERYARTPFYRGMALLLEGISRELAETQDIDISRLDELKDLM